MEKSLMEGSLCVNVSGVKKNLISFIHVAKNEQTEEHCDDDSFCSNTHQKTFCVNFGFFSSVSFCVVPLNPNGFGTFLFLFSWSSSQQHIDSFLACVFPHSHVLHLGVDVPIGCTFSQCKTVTINASHVQNSHFKKLNIYSKMLLHVCFGISAIFSLSIFISRSASFLTEI